MPSEPTPADVVTAIQAVARYLATAHYGSAIIAPGGGASFHLRNVLEEKADLFREIARLEAARADLMRAYNERGEALGQCQADVAALVGVAQRAGRVVTWQQVQAEEATLKRVSLPTEPVAAPTAGEETRVGRVSMSIDLDAIWERYHDSATTPDDVRRLLLAYDGARALLRERGDLLLQSQADLVQALAQLDAYRAADARKAALLAQIAAANQGEAWYVEIVREEGAK